MTIRSLTEDRPAFAGIEAIVAEQVLKERQRCAMTMPIRAASSFIAIVVAAAALTAAPQGTSGPVLDEGELRQAMSATGAPDHAKLAAHYTALADRYGGDSARHAEMAKGYSTNTSRAGGPDMRGHCIALANLNAGMEKSARNLAKFHTDSAATAAKPAPSGSMGGQMASHGKVGEAEKAPAPSDHAAVAAYFNRVADRYTADAKMHDAMAAMYRTGRTAGMADHCERLARDARAAAKHAREAAAQH